MPAMPYRRLGRSGLSVSVLSFGSWVTFDTQLHDRTAVECMEAAWEAGVNFFDNAEAYAGGESERIMGRALRSMGLPRHAYVISTKFFWGLHDGPNMRNTLNRKYLAQAIDGSLERLGLDHVDLVFCHRSDPETPLEETVWAMHDMVASGKALYWGTSEWPADRILQAWRIADRHHLHKPVMEQPQYHLLHRDRVEREYAPLYEEIGLGTTTWSPLASGLLTGKYLDGVRRLVPIAEELGCTLAQLAIAWCAANPHVSTVITGASRVEQVRENLGALAVLERLDDELLGRIELAVR
jgi:voltage-dependent potassium channel beta subunit